MSTLRSEVYARLFQNSPSPQPVEEQGTADELWSYEVVSEEVAFDGEIRYEVVMALPLSIIPSVPFGSWSLSQIDWDDWQRADGTTQTWQDLSPTALREWERTQNRKRKALTQDSIDIELGGLAGTDIHNFPTCLRAQAFDEKLKVRANYKPTLEDEMRDLLNEKLDPAWNPDGLTSAPVGQARRGLRQSTVRQQSKAPGPTRASVPPQFNEWTKSTQAAGAASIAFVNEVDDEERPKLAPDFKYIEKGYIYADGIEKPSQDFQIGCVCRRCDSPSNCECQGDSEVVNKNGNKAFAYKDAGLFAFRTSRGTEVIECNAACSCGPNCINRTSQRPRDVPLEIFKTREKGWGVRASVDIPRGKVLGMYSGRLITREEALNNHGGYIFDLDGQENPEDGQEGGIKGKFSVDAETCGNWTRFVNPNISLYLAVYDTIPATNQPYITFVAHEFIKSGTELTLDYNPGHADNRAGYSEGMKKCFCGSDTCRGWVRMS